MSDITAAGTFEVTLQPTPSPDPSISLMVLEKRFAGELSGTSVGQMLSVGSPRAGAAGYVAMERVTATLGGQHGSFALQHSGTIDQGIPSLTVSVVPGSGTDDLAGLTGTMKIDITGGQHHYILTYALPSDGHPD